MAYVPNPLDVTQPVESVLAQTAAAEFRALKAYIQQIVSGGGLGVETPGQVAMFPAQVAPPGWLELDGSLVLRSTYPALWAQAQAMNGVVTEANWFAGYLGLFSSGDLATNFRLPDWRGLFPRSWNHGKAGANVDPGRDIGNLQAATGVQNNGGPIASGVIVSGATAQGLINPDETVSIATNFNQVGVGIFGNGVLQGASVRPINISTMFCVKT